jgi:hypothetical protein
MGHPDKTCRTCMFYTNGRGINVNWPYGYGRCTIPVWGHTAERPVHANSRACESYLERGK